MHRRFPRFFFLAVLGVFAFLAISGPSKSFAQACRPIPIQDASVNWAVFGTVVKAEKCSGKDTFVEKYKLANGGGLYKGLSNKEIIPEVSEPNFRKWLKSKKPFAKKAGTIKLHFPKINDHPTIFAHIRKKNGKQFIAFQMNSGVPINFTLLGARTGWPKLNLGVLRNETLSKDAFREDFLRRLKVFETPAAADFISSSTAAPR